MHFRGEWNLLRTPVSFFPGQFIARAIYVGALLFYNDLDVFAFGY